MRVASRSGIRSSAVVLPILLVAACGSSGTASKPGGSGGGGSSGSFHVGMTLDLSGPLSSVGQPQRDGAKAYIDYVNAHGGVDGHQIDLKVLDDAATATRGTANATQLISQDKVSALFGFTLSNVCAAVAPIATARKVPAICQSLPDTLLYPAKDYLYSAAAAVSAQAAPIVAAAKQTGVDIKKVAFVALATAATTGLVDQLKAEAKTNGWTVVADESVALDATDVGAEASKLAAAKPDIVFSVLKNSLEIPLARELAADGLAAPILGYTAIDYNSLSAVKSDKLLTVSDLSSGGTAGTGFDDYSAIVKAAGGAPLQGFLAAGYAQAEIVVNALKSCGYPCSGEKMNGALNTLSFSDNGFSASRVSYTSTNHQAVHAMYVYTWDPATSAPKLLGLPVSTGH
jgi:branched-chain amino acid transport system substrate-binding protein